MSEEKMSVNRTCNNCHIPLSLEVKGIYCRSCLSIRKHDICEFITSTKITIFNEENIEQLQPLIDQSEISVRLDLHGVLDTIDNTVVFDHPESICCISFVGSTTKTRLSAREDIMTRLGHQVSYGILLFSRGGNTYHKVGGKAWINKLIPSPTGKKAIFIDDSPDHYESTKSLKIYNLDCHLYNQQHNNLYKLINRYL